MSSYHDALFSHCAITFIEKVIPQICSRITETRGSTRNRSYFAKLSKMYSSAKLRTVFQFVMVFSWNMHSRMEEASPRFHEMKTV